MPTSTTPYCREAGAGPAVICLHANASTSGQWRALMERLSDRFRVIAVDTYGAGKSPDWPQGRAVQLADEVALLAPVFQSAGDAFHLVGHSYGAAIALKTALSFPARVRSMALYEPTLFAVLVRIIPGSPRAESVRPPDASQAVARCASTPRPRLLDYGGRWPRKASRSAPPGLPALAQHHGGTCMFSALRSQLRAVDNPVLYMSARSPRLRRGVARRSRHAAPLSVLELDGVVHCSGDAADCQCGHHLPRRQVVS